MSVATPTDHTIRAAIVAAHIITEHRRPERREWTYPWASTRNGRGPYPPHGQFVVYRLWLDDRLVYVGHTMRLQIRLERHRGDRRPFDRWDAAECANSREAVALEDHLIDTLRPPQNKIVPGVGRYTRRGDDL